MNLKTNEQRKGREGEREESTIKYNIESKFHSVSYKAKVPLIHIEGDVVDGGEVGDDEGEPGSLRRKGVSLALWGLISDKANREGRRKRERKSNYHFA